MSVSDKMTLYTEDGQWKADFRAWKDYWLFYASIGTKVDVYHREATHDVWGNKTTDWVKRPATISIKNTYQGSIAGSPKPPDTGDTPQSGGLGNFVEVSEFYGNHAELRMWATGFFDTTISVAGPQTNPAGAKLDISTVVGQIAVITPGGTMHGVVGASSYVSDNSAW